MLYKVKWYDNDIDKRKKMKIKKIMILVAAISNHV